MLTHHPAHPTSFSTHVGTMSRFHALRTTTTLTTTGGHMSGVLTGSSRILDSHIGTSALGRPRRVGLTVRIIILHSGLRPCFTRNHCRSTLIRLTRLHRPISTFFSGIVIVISSGRLHVGHLAVLRGLHRLFLHITSVSLLRWWHHCWGTYRLTNFFCHWVVRRPLVVFY